MIKSKDTPTHLEFPEFLCVEIIAACTSQHRNIKNIIMDAKYYENGAISMLLHLKLSNYPLDQFHLLRNINIHCLKNTFNIKEIIQFQFQNIYKIIKDSISHMLYEFRTLITQDYMIFMGVSRLNITRWTTQKNLLLCLQL
ncbi:MAG: hypothetical protein BAJALOKI1v1_990008 [Promethearchaeota archaeon]|nr:MAG: hypothetical protein BAJALOKI1v1_990008 [Candidatus Lokiarchaeota archaeon]